MSLFIIAVIVLVIALQNIEFRIIGSIAGLAILFFSYMVVRKQKNHPVWPAIIIYLLIGAFVTYGSDYIMTKVLKDYQAERVLVTVGVIDDDSDLTFNITQSKMTIGSGGIAGKGYLEGTLTQSEQVPEQSTDFIFSTIGEEQGFLGIAAIVGLFVLLMFRAILIGERARNAFTRVYAYSYMGFILVHFFINIGMTMGLVPIMGIPLPFISYGGTSCMIFSLMTAVLLKLDTARHSV